VETYNELAHKAAHIVALIFFWTTKSHKGYHPLALPNALLRRGDCGHATRAAQMGDSQ
jgi:hypothetical protein